jgi:hypothetical protein
MRSAPPRALRVATYASRIPPASGEPRLIAGIGGGTPAGETYVA